jgi:hypothetical protein
MDIKATTIFLTTKLNNDEQALSGDGRHAHD